MCRSYAFKRKEALLVFLRVCFFPFCFNSFAFFDKYFCFFDIKMRRMLDKRLFFSYNIYIL